MCHDTVSEIDDPAGRTDAIVGGQAAQLAVRGRKACATSPPRARGVVLRDVGRGDTDLYQPLNHLELVAVAIQPTEAREGTENVDTTRQELTKDGVLGSSARSPMRRRLS